MEHVGSSECNEVEASDRSETGGGRRDLLRLAAAAAAGAVTVAVGATASPVAATGIPLVLGQDNPTSIGGTTLTYTGTSAIGTVLVAQAGSTYSPTSSSFPSAIGGWTVASDVPNGIYGYTDVVDGSGVVGSARTFGVYGEGWGSTGTPAGVLGHGPVGVAGVGTLPYSNDPDAHWTGVRGEALGPDGTGVEGHGTVGVRGVGADYGLVSAAGGKANLLLSPTNAPSLPGTKTAPPARSDAHQLGELELDATGDLWLCVAAGAPGTWRKLGGLATGGSFHPITPTRVYDSRFANPPLASGALAAGGQRVVSIKDARPEGAVTSADVVPAGATAITYNLAVVETVGAGFLSVNPGDATSFTAATINWSGAGQVLNNGTVVKLDGSRQVKVFAGGSGGTQFLIDVTGYYL